MSGALNNAPGVRSQRMYSGPARRAPVWLRWAERLGAHIERLKLKLRSDDIAGQPLAQLQGASAEERLEWANRNAVPPNPLLPARFERWLRAPFGFEPIVLPIPGLAS